MATENPNKPVIKKLGIMPGMRTIIMREPAGYLELMPELRETAKLDDRLEGRFDFIQYFATSFEQLNAVAPNLTSHLEPGGMLWISWVKRTSRLHTGLNEGIVREVGLKAGLVDVKVASLTADWSGLKFVYRLADR